MQLGRGGECLACKGVSRTTNLKPQQPVIGMLFTNADPRYAGRLDDKQGGDTIVTMERVREAIAFNAELADESTWLWLTSEQIGFPLRPTGGGEHEERADDLDSSQEVHDRLVAYHLAPAIPPSQGVCDHLVAYHLAPAVTDFISDENRECCNNDLEQTLTRWFRQNLKLVAGMRRASGRIENHHVRRYDYMLGPRMRMDNH